MALIQPTIEDFAQLLAQAGPSLEDQLVREMCEGSLHDFVREFWNIVEPGRPFVDNWHLQWMCKELEGISKGETTHLLMNVPPGAMKSLLLVFWTAWEWGPRNMPTLRYLCASYTQTLTIRDNRRRKAILSDEKYKRLWPHVRIDPNRTSDENFGNISTGWCIATSTGGVGTGERADRVVVDDAHSVNTAESDAIRNQTLHWWREVVPTRVNDPQKSAFIVVMQRVHAEDVAGDILDNRGDEWVHVMIPMRYEPDRHCRTEHGEDPRGLDEDGNLLPGMTEPGIVEPNSPLAQRAGKLYWPERFPEWTVIRDSIPLGRYGVSSQFQQMPSPRGGGIVLDAWWQIWPPAGEFEKWVRPTLLDDGRIVNVMSFPPSEFTVAYLDTAFTEKETNAYCAMICFDVFADSDGHPKVMMRNAWQEHPTLRQLCDRVLETCRRHRVDCLVIENKAGAPWVKQEMAKLMKKGEFSIVLDEPRSDKVARLHSVAPLFEDKMIFAPNRDWADLVIKQCVVGETPIITGRGVIAAKDVGLGDMVLTHLGRFRPVIELSNRDVSEIVVLEGKSLDVLKLTAEHPVYTVRIGQDRKPKGSLSWVPSGEILPRHYRDVVRDGRTVQEPDLRAHDSLVLPMPIRENPIDEIDFREWIRVLPAMQHQLYSNADTVISKHSKCKQILYRQKLDRAFGRIMGLYAAEGWHNRYNVTWAFNANLEMHLATEVSEFIKTRIGGIPRVKVVNNCVRVDWSMALLSDFFDDFGFHASSKRFPQWVFEAPDEFIEGLLEGYQEGDGYTAPSGKMVATTVSPTLCWHVRLLGMRLGLSITSLFAKAAGTTVMKGKVYPTQAVYMMTWRKDPGHKGATIDLGTHYGYSVMRSATVNGPEKVYNFSVLDDQSYVTTGGIVHNCAEFPKGKYKDLVDCLSGSLGYLRRNDLIKLAVEHDEDEREKKIFRGNQGGIADLYEVS